MLYKNTSFSVIAFRGIVFSRKASFSPAHAGYTYANDQYVNIEISLYGVKVYRRGYVMLSQTPEALY